MKKKRNTPAPRYTPKRGDIKKDLSPEQLAGIGAAALAYNVARAPTYAPAWALLARAYGFAAGGSLLRFRGSIEDARAIMRAGMSKGEMAAREAIRLDPTHSGGYSALGDIENRRGNRLAAEELREKALALDPGDADNLERHAAALGAAGRLQNALRLKRQLAVLEPFVPAYNVTHAELLLSLGERETAIRMLEAITPDPNILVARNVWHEVMFWTGGIPRPPICYSRQRQREICAMRSKPPRASCGSRRPTQRRKSLCLCSYREPFTRMPARTIV